MAADRFGLHGSGEPSGICFVNKREMHLRPSGIPHHCRCVIVAGLLLPHNTTKKVSDCVQLGAASRSFSLHNNAHDKVGSQLTVLDQTPRHSGH
jgi:hypothetical protein